ncbi:MAG: pyridoxine 5'-phosphate synthase [Litoreibacter sp.]|nr:pyridoxine 5'-phosphate synthase [Litoreibacter sp.]
MVDLSVNLNVAALLRNRRGHHWPDVVGLGRIALEAGAAGLTVHPRPDERHAKASDAYALRALIADEFPDRELNVEGYPDKRFLDLVGEVAADQVTLVPDGPDQETSDHGWDFVNKGNELRTIVEDLRSCGHRVSLFADPDARVIPAAAATGTDRVELYTGPFGAAYGVDAAQALALDSLEAAAEAAIAAGIKVNAGHDLTVPNTAILVSRIPYLSEVSIGHALFCDALSYGMKETVERYLSSCRSHPDS